ncbi:GNAT family N-acetyltransferase [Flindersiella endophytica]
MSFDFSFRSVDPVGDAELLHGWVTHPKCAYWLMQDASLADVIEEYQEIARKTGHDALLGLDRGRASFLVERYDPAEELGDHYAAEAGDVGMHFLVPPTTEPVHGFTRAVIVAVMELLFSDPATRRVVVEPDVRNTAVHALNAYVGFGVLGPVRLPHKQALLSVCTREQFENARATGGVRL